MSEKILHHSRSKSHAIAAKVLEEQSQNNLFLAATGIANSTINGRKTPTHNPDISKRISSCKRGPVI